MKPPVLCIMGPTASGKTALAENLAQERAISLISVDSALVYRGMDIGTGKPSTPHALIDILDPAQSYSAADFCHQATLAIEAAYLEGKQPCLVGGTMLYFKALLQGLSELPPADAKVREELAKQLETHGSNFLWERLKQVDPLAAQKIHPNDPQRLSRALEVFEITGKPLTEHFASQKSFPYQHVNIALWPTDRAALHHTIETRFDEMLAAGFVEEVKALYERSDLHENLPSIRSVGYRQIWAFLQGKQSYAQAREQAIAATRQLAKRQLTWLRNWTNIKPIYYQKTCAKNALRALID